MTDEHLHSTMAEFLQYLELEGRKETARGYRTSIAIYCQWLREQGDVDPLEATTEVIRAYQRYLAEEYIAKTGLPLGKRTQGSYLCAVKSYYRWMARRGLTLLDQARQVKIPSIPKGMVSKDHLTLQEVTAFLQTQARACCQYNEGSFKWAREVRDLTILCIGFAIGRRRSGIRNLKLESVNLKRSEIRCDWEKGKAGRVLPIAEWANNILRIYIEQARPVLNWRPDNDWLIVGVDSPQIGKETMNQLMLRVHKETCEQNPDLTELPDKHMTTHSMRVSFATMLFSGGCNIRSVNEMMLHTSLNTTARYTPIALDDLRRAVRHAHPRA